MYLDEIVTSHVVGRHLYGERVRYYGGVNDEEFEREIASKGLPSGWFAFHFNVKECEGAASLRVQAIRKLPIATDAHGRRRSWKRDLAESREQGS